MGGWNLDQIYSQTLCKIANLVLEKFPYADLNTQSRIPIDKLWRAQRIVRRTLEEVASGAYTSIHAPRNITDWGLVVAAKLEPYLYISDEDQCEYVDFAGKYGIWKITKKDKATKALTRNVLLDELCLMGLRINDDGKREARPRSGQGYQRYMFF